MTYREAIRDGMRQALTEDERGLPDGRGRRQLRRRVRGQRDCSTSSGPERIRDTPLVRVGVRRAPASARRSTGMRPIVEVMTINFSMLALDQVVNNAATLALHVGRAAERPARRPHGDRRRPPDRRAACPQPRGLVRARPRDQVALAGDGRRRPRDGARRARRSRPGVRLRERGPVRDRGRRPRRTASPTSGRRRSGARAATSTRRHLLPRRCGRCWRRPSSSPRGGIEAEVIDLRSLRPLDMDDRARVARQDPPGRDRGRGLADRRASPPRSARRSWSAASTCSTGRCWRVCSAEIPMPYAKHLEDAALPERRAHRRSRPRDGDLGRGRVRDAGSRRGHERGHAARVAEAAGRPGRARRDHRDRPHRQGRHRGRGLHERGDRGARRRARHGGSDRHGARADRRGGRSSGGEAEARPGPCGGGRGACRAGASPRTGTRAGARRRRGERPPAARVAVGEAARRRARGRPHDRGGIRAGWTHPTEGRRAREGRCAAVTSAGAGSRCSNTRGRCPARGCAAGGSRAGSCGASRRSSLGGRAGGDATGDRRGDEPLEARDPALSTWARRSTSAGRSRGSRTRTRGGRFPTGSSSASLLVKAVALALRDFPELNARWEGEQVVRSERIHVGNAIFLRGGGLVAPAIHDTDQRSLDELMRSFRDLVARARSFSLRASEMSDPTITVTSIGERGVDVIYPIIVPPQVAIVGFGKVVDRPWVVERTAPRLPRRHRHRLRRPPCHRRPRGSAFLAAIDQRLQEPEDL